jgi:multidrug efflux pump subunit AcrB
VIRHFIHRPILACSVALLMLLVGGVSIITLPVSQYPDIVPGTVQVTASYPGADAETTARVITQPLEQQINGVEGMIYMSSNSTSNGSSSITVTFDIGYDLNIAAVDVQNRVQTAEAQLPSETQQAGVSVVKQSADIAIIISLKSTEGAYDNTFLGNYAQINVVDPLTRVPGVGSITIFGLKNYSIRIWIDPEKMAALGLTMTDVTSAVTDQNKDIAAGNIGQPPVSGQPSVQYQVTTLGQLLDASEFEDIIVRANNDGSVVRISDIGRAELGAQDYSTTTTLNQKPTATMAIYQLPGANAMQVASGIQATMKSLEQSFPEGMEWETTFNITDFLCVVGGTGDHAAGGDPSCGAGGLHIPAELASHAHTDHCHSGFAHRDLCSVGRL